MLTVEMRGDDAIELGLKEYPRKERKAFVRALNRAINSGRTLMTREIAKDTGLKSKDVREALVMREADASRPEASLAARLKRLTLIDFNARQTKRGVSYRLPGGKGSIEGAFIATTRTQQDGSGGQHRGVFKRVGKSRLPIKQRYGPSLGRVFAKFRAAALARAFEVFQKNFDHEMEFANPGGPDVGAD